MVPPYMAEGQGRNVTHMKKETITSEMPSSDGKGTFVIQETRKQVKMKDGSIASTSEKKVSLVQ